MTTLYEIVRHKNDLTQLLLQVSICLVLLLTFICIGLYFSHFGFDRGLMVNDHIEAILKAGQFAADGPRTYEFFANKYKFMTVMLFLVLVGLFMTNRLVANRKPCFGLLSLFLCLVGLGISLYQVLRIVMDKALRASEEFWNLTYESLLRDTVLFDWFCVATLMVLIAMQVPIFVQLLVTKPKNY